MEGVITIKRYIKPVYRKGINTSFPDSKNIVKLGTYKESILLGIEKPVKKSGLLKQCPICSQVNYIPFQSPILDRQGLKVISRISWVTCIKCNTSYSL